MPTRSDRRTSISRRMARFNRSIANPVVRRFAGWLPPLAIVLHRGRRTGRAFATPVLAFGTADGLVVGVLYGIESDWVRNVQAAGRAQVRRRGVVRDYERARLVGREKGIRLLPPAVGFAFRALKVRGFIRLETASAADRAT